MWIKGTDNAFADIHGNLFDGTGDDSLSRLPREYLDNDSRTSRSFSMFGDPKRAQAEAESFRAHGLALAGRQAPNAQMDPAALAARQGQIGAMNNYMNQIRGTGPSMAPSVMNRGMDAAAARGNMAAGMAGPGGAGAQRLAMLGAGGAANAAATGAAGVRAGEVSNAYQGYMGGAGQLVGNDIGAAQRQVDMDLRNRRFGDKIRGAYEDAAMGIEETQMKGQHGRLAGLVNAQDSYTQAYNKRYADRRARNSGEMDMTLGFATGGLSAAGSAL